MKRWVVQGILCECGKEIYECSKMNNRGFLKPFQQKESLNNGRLRYLNLTWWFGSFEKSGASTWRWVVWCSINIRCG